MDIIERTNTYAMKKTHERLGRTSLNITKRMKISMVVLALPLGSHAIAQESPKSIVDFIYSAANSNVREYCG
tara:strand:+ start:46 stop:261 length:216 start_codon:yes stop_codon:yes gene_type:complete